MPWEVARPLIIRVRDVSFLPDRNRWFKFLKWSFISTIDFASKPPVIDFFRTQSNGLDLIILGLRKMGIFPSFSVFTLRILPRPFLPFSFQSLHSLGLFLPWTFVEENFWQSSGGATIHRYTRRSRNQHSRAFFFFCTPGRSPFHHLCCSFFFFLTFEHANFWS